MFDLSYDELIDERDELTTLTDSLRDEIENLQNLFDEKLDELHEVLTQISELENI